MITTSLSLAKLQVTVVYSHRAIFIPTMQPQFFFFWLVACFPVVHAWMSFNGTTDTHKVVCIYPISGSYSLLQRLNYYALLVFVIFSRHKKLLVQGAAAAVMIFAGVTAVHAFALSCSTTRNRAAFDMDVFGTWAVLGITSVFLSPFLQWSAVLRKSEARPLVQCWGILVACGTICATVNVWRNYEVSYPCVNFYTNTTVTSIPFSPPDTDQYLNCTPSCFASHQSFRNPSELLVVNMSRVFDDSFERAANWPGIFITIAGVLGLFSSLSRDSDKDPLEMSKGKKRVEACLAIFAYGSPILFIVAVVLNETYLLHSPSLPLGEAPHSVGQWGCWVATILVLMSTLLDKTSSPAKTGDTFANVGPVPSVTVPPTMSGGAVAILSRKSSDGQEEDEKLEGAGETPRSSDSQTSQSATHDPEEQTSDVADAEEDEFKEQKPVRKTTMQILKEDHEKMQRT